MGIVLSAFDDSIPPLRPGEEEAKALRELKESLERIRLGFINRTDAALENAAQDPWVQNREFFEEWHQRYTDASYERRKAVSDAASLLANYRIHGKKDQDPGEYFWPIFFPYQGANEL